MRLHRFYVNKPLGEELVVERADSEKEIVHQWLRVFRYQEGDEVLLFSSFNPSLDYHYLIGSISKDSVTLTLLGTKEQPTKSPISVTLCMALTKKDTFETVVRQASELGVEAIIPILAERSEKKGLSFERLQKIATEAAEQSGRGAVMHIFPIMSISEALEKTKATANIVGSLHGKALTTMKDKAVNLWVGPEGGWTDQEEKNFEDKGFTLMKSVSTTLKADTAAINLISLVLG